ncbi:MAG: hypothetical protein EOO11_14015 [Chitinophagaceae bacterium]|nr:MAG: hypothetical protein EOO11_14015 [Chitinophagaceae bacterium]
MAAPMQALTEPLLNKSFAECSAGELRQLTEQYPYFAPAHFLLLKKLDPASEEYRVQYQKALLYFHDPLSFELLLNRELLHEAEAPVTDEVAAPTTVALDGSVEAAVIPEVEAPLPVPEEKAPEEKELQPLAGTDEAENAATSTEPAPPPGAVTPETETLDAGDPTDGRAELRDEEVAAPSPLPAPAFSIDLSAPATGDLSFEPFHTVDYFASQGIRLGAGDDVPRDKLGKQLKSFTDWLKTMKRLPEATTPDALDAKTEQKVEHLADDSLQRADIVTESMAEVWLKQGNKRKAAEIYRKLSLLHPAKSAYFADKINSLND